MNRFFSTLKQAMDNIDKVRMELAHKYYALAETQPDLKVDLFGSRTRETDLNRIQRVSVFKTKTDGILCAATLTERRCSPGASRRSNGNGCGWRKTATVTNATWRPPSSPTCCGRDRRRKRTPARSRRKSICNGKAKRQRPNVQTTLSRNPLREKRTAYRKPARTAVRRYKEIKDELPEAIVLFKHEGSYYASMYDAETIANELNLPPQKERLAYDPDKMILAFEHDDEETRTQILSLRAFTIDCAAPGLQQETGEQNENEQHPTFRSRE